MTRRMRDGGQKRPGRSRAIEWLLMAILAVGASTAWAQEAAQQPAQEPKPWMEIYGFAMSLFREVRFR